MPYQLQVTINGQVHVLPASVLTTEGTQAVINMMAAQSPPPPPPQNQNQHQHLHLHHHQLHSEQQLAPSGPEAAWFTAAELAGMANGVFPEQPEDDQQQHDHHHHQPASASPPHLTTTTPTPSPPRHHHRNNNNNNSKTLPPHFPGYRWAAQSIALRQQSSPAVRLGTIYGAMAAMWPDHFSASSPASASWKSGVRHAVLKHFKRVGGGGAGGGGGVWYQPDPENLMTKEEARRVVEGRGGEGPRVRAASAG
ncbi:hypothetical protein SLS54_010576 [Diplodia seriata]